MTAATSSPPRKRSGKHLRRKFPWRPTPEIRAGFETYAASRAQAEGRSRYPLTRAVEELIERGLDREEGAERLSRVQADSIEERLDILSAQVSTLEGDTQTLAYLLDASAPQALAPSRIVAAWMADDPEQWQAGEREEAAEERILEDIEQVSRTLWTTWMGEITDVDPPMSCPAAGPSAGEGGFVIASYLMRARPRQADCEDIHWKIDPAVLRRLKAVAKARKTTASRLATALIELGLDILDGRSTVPLHRAAMLETQVGRLSEALGANAERLRVVRRRVDLLGSRSCGLFDVFLHWYAEHIAHVHGRGSDEDQVEAVENELRARFLVEAERAWDAVAQSILGGSGDDRRRDDEPLDTAIEEEEPSAASDGAPQPDTFEEEFR